MKEKQSEGEFRKEFADEQKLVRYCWIDEKEHYCDSEHPKGHIFATLKRLNKKYKVGMETKWCGAQGCDVERE